MKVLKKKSAVIAELFVVVAMVISLMPTTVVYASDYNPDAAVSYAAAHWNDGIGVCDQFVKACLSAGGVNISAGGVTNLKNALDAYGTSYLLVTSGSYINASDNIGKVAAGDPIFFYCSVDGYVHTAICSGVDSSGHICAYGHSAAWNNLNYLATFHDSNGHRDSYISVYSVHMSSGGAANPDAGPRTEYGTYYVTIPSNYEVSCYTNATDTSRSRHINGSGNSFELICDQKVTFPNGSVRYHFNDADGNSLYFDYASSMSVKIPVVKYVVSYNANGGSGGPSGQTKTQAVSLTLSSMIPVRNGFTFEGWSTDPSATQAQYAAGGTYSADADVVLYAVWKQNVTYKVTYNANGGSDAPAMQTKNKDEQIRISSAEPTKMFTISFDANGGTCSDKMVSITCSFESWNTQADGGGTVYYAGESYSDNDDLTLYAQWGNPNVGAVLPTTVRNGYSFNGWYTQLVGGMQIKLGTVLTNIDSVTLYAHWIQQYQTNSFQDLDQNDFYYKPVLWAAAKGITTGTSTTTFSPANVCTRVQAVTFLWRAKGSPAPIASASNFTDVIDDGSDSSQAIEWAAENGIARGVSATQFAPNESVTRGQFLTFLWRCASQSNVSGSNPFTDVSSNSYYFNSVMWAYGLGITSGTSATTFSPGRVCTRGQVVTFLYRYLGE